MKADILLIDDEADFTAALARLLRRRGHEVALAASGAAGLELARTRRFDVVLLDVKMPGVGGLAVLSELRRTRPRTQVILMTGHIAPGEEDRCLANGAFAYLLKPYPTERLLDLIASAGAAAAPEPVPPRAE